MEKTKRIFQLICVLLTANLAMTTSETQQNLAHEKKNQSFLVSILDSFENNVSNTPTNSSSGIQIFNPNTLELNEMFNFTKSMGEISRFSDCSHPYIFYVLKNQTYIEVLSESNESSENLINSDIKFEKSQLGFFSANVIVVNKTQSRKVFQIDYRRNDEVKTWDVLSFSLKLDDSSYTFDIMKVSERSITFYDILTGFSIFILAFVYIVLITINKVKFQAIEIEHEGDIQTWHSILFVGLGSTVLILIFYFRKFILLIYTGLVVFQCYIALFLMIEYYLFHFKLNKINLLEQELCKVSLHRILNGIFTLILTLMWFFSRNWLLNNLFSYCLVMAILSVFTVNNMKIAFVLLFSMFFYDIFWVYYSSRIFSENLMVNAAMQLNLPIKLELYIFNNDNPLKSCMFLGLGDLVLPGFLIKYCRKFDFLKKCHTYYLTSLVTYFISLLSAGITLFVFNHAQPVLFFIFPIMMSGLFYSAYSRGEVLDFWKGSHTEINSNYRESNQLELSESV